MPSWPSESITTFTASVLPVATPRMPAIKMRVCYMLLPMRMVLDSPATALGVANIDIVDSPVVRCMTGSRAQRDIAVARGVGNRAHSMPMAVLATPVVLRISASLPVGRVADHQWCC